MGKLLSPSNSQEIIDSAESSHTKLTDRKSTAEETKSLPLASTSRLPGDARLFQGPSPEKGKPKATDQELEAERLKSMKRSDQTRHMVRRVFGLVLTNYQIKTLGQASNPITNSDLYLRCVIITSDN